MWIGSDLTALTYTTGSDSTMPPIATTTLPPVETTPVLFIRFTAKADARLVHLVEERLEEEGLIVIETEHTKKGGAVIGITTTQNKLEWEAQAIKIMRKRQDTQIMEAFDTAHRELYFDESQEYTDAMGLFSPNDWSLLLVRILEDVKVLPEDSLSSSCSSKLSLMLDELEIPYKQSLEYEHYTDDTNDDSNTIHDRHLLPNLFQEPTKPLRHVLESAGYIDAVAPIHRTAFKNHVWNEICRNIMPPVHLIRQYYGEEMAFYFGWMGYLTIWLCFPGIVGLGAYCYRWYREDNIMNDEYTPFYGLITFLWSTLFLKFWRRQEVRWSYHWGVLMGEYEKQKYFAVRPEFHGTLRKSPISSQYEVYYPAYKRRIKYCVSALITLLMLKIAFWTMILSLNMQGYINPKYDAERWDFGKRHPFHWPFFSKLAEPGELFDMDVRWKSYIPAIIHVATISTFNSIYHVVAVRLTEWENHPTKLSFNNSLIMKRFLFEAFDCYVALFYLAFYERNIDKLRKELIAIFNIDTARRVALECLVPVIMKRVDKKRRETDFMSFRMSGSKAKKLDPMVTAVHTPLADQANLDIYEQFDDFMEIIIQFGYCTLFASAYPLASTISIFANLIEIRADAFKLTRLCRRPRSMRADGLNVWNTLLKGIVWLSALTNCLIFGFTSGQLMEWLPNLYIMTDDDHLRFRDNKGWIVIFIIFGLERAFLCFGLLINAVVPDVPEDVFNELEHKHYIQEQEAREHEHHSEKVRAKKQRLAMSTTAVTGSAVTRSAAKKKKTSTRKRR